MSWHDAVRTFGAPLGVTKIESRGDKLLLGEGALQLVASPDDAGVEIFDVNKKSVGRVMWDGELATGSAVVRAAVEHWRTRATETK